MDYMDFNLQSYLESHALDDKTKKDLANQLLDGMEYLHNHSIVHGDLASGNVMIKVTKDNELVLKITDFILGPHFQIRGTLFLFIVSIVISIMNAIMDNVIIDGLLKGYKK